MKCLLSLVLLCLLGAQALMALSEDQFNTLARFAKTEPSTWDLAQAEGYLKQAENALPTAKGAAKGSLKMYKSKLEKGINLIKSAPSVAISPAQKTVVTPTSLQETPQPLVTPTPPPVPPRPLVTPTPPPVPPRPLVTPTPPPVPPRLAETIVAPPVPPRNLLLERIQAAKIALRPLNRNSEAILNHVTTVVAPPQGAAPAPSAALQQASSGINQLQQTVQQQPQPNRDVAETLQTLQTNVSEQMAAQGIPLAPPVPPRPIVAPTPPPLPPLPAAEQGTGHQTLPTNVAEQIRAGKELKRAHTPTPEERQQARETLQQADTAATSIARGFAGHEAAARQQEEIAAERERRRFEQIQGASEEEWGS